MIDIKHDVLVSVNVKDKNKLLLKIYESGINIKKIKYLKDELEFETSIENYFNLKKYIKSYKFKIKNNVGLFFYLSVLKKNKVFVINIALAIILLYIFSNTIISVKVVHSKKYIRDIVTSSLEEYGIKKLSWKKNYKELSKIKEKILESYPKNLEWLEIEQIGMTYVVRVEERIITEIEPEKQSCNIVATKNGIVTDIHSNKGQELVSVGDYVKTGDIIISGEIKFNDSIKNIVCASGEVMAEVWYTSEIKLPLEYKEEKYTSKKRYNFAFNNTKIFKSRLKDYKTKKRKLFTLFKVDIYLLTEYEVSYNTRKYSSKEALNRALKLSNEKINLKLGEKEEIIDQKVLKNSINNSTMYVEIFTSVKEVISKEVEFQREEKEVE